MRVVTEHMDSVRSAALGIWIGTGSGLETDEQAGLSHLLEHMLFRGTPRFSSLEIDQLFDSMGAEVNAGTGRESTSVYARVQDHHVGGAFDAMAELVFSPNLAGDDLDNERQIVLEEIAMYEDDPQELVFDRLGEAVFGSHPLGRAIIGRAAVVAGVSAAELREFHDERYAGENIVVAAAGAIEHEQVVALVDALAPRRPAMAARDAIGEPLLERRREFLAKDTEQYHLCLGAPGLDRHDERRFALRVLDTILGTAGSSRLFQEVREKRGLAYSVFCFSSLYARTGQVGIYVGTRPDNVEQALEVIAGELVKLRDNPATVEELQRAKENAKGRMVLALESPSARMNRLGANTLTGSELLTLEEMEARIDAVTLEDLQQLARDLYATDRLSAAGVGPDPELFERALEPVYAELAA